ncbi:hypothetical protein HBDW_19120 [Herbaspirillum sp. DW155]|uniref:hypothetical protein n=1 Tax=Herbaspirillum sp. DW155 TaxID=3095609 RepID=UPI00308764AA|nr:hypothetical protein HBDW_19120 [Herbaspirillum sp. DW155]
MIPAIPTEDRTNIISQQIPEQVAQQRQELAQAMNTFRIEAVHHFSNVLPPRFSVMARVVRNRGPLTCLSCGAKTDALGELPCGH